MKNLKVFLILLILILISIVLKADDIKDFQMKGWYWRCLGD